MIASEERQVVCYLDWCGADAAFRFGSQAQYEAARQFLSALSTGRLARPADESLTSQSNFYFIDSKDREAFQNFMEQTASRAE